MEGGMLGTTEMMAINKKAKDAERRAQNRGEGFDFSDYKSKLIAEAERQKRFDKSVKQRNERREADLRKMRAPKTAPAASVGPPDFASSSFPSGPVMFPAYVPQASPVGPGFAAPADWSIAAGMGPFPGSIVPQAVASPPPGGSDNDDQVRGVTSRKHVAWLLFRALARGDFHHDFGENKPDRDKFTKADENRFFEIAKRVSKKGSVELRAKFNRYIGENLYKIIADKINIILPERVSAETAGSTETEILKTGVEDGKFAGEDELLDIIGINWKDLKGEIAGMDVGTDITKTFASKAVAGGRSYQIRACPYRQSLDRNSPGYKVNTAPIEALATVSDGKTDFALIIDASGGLPLSDLRDRNLLTGGGGGRVYIIENIENGADSATKLLPPPLKPKGPSDLPPAPDLKFLRDNVNTINYPLWTTTGDQKSNIFSTLFIILNRISEDNVEANLIIKNDAGATKESYSIGDIANASNVKNASLYALATMIDKGTITNEMLIYTLIKRMGDWCQALSLLDLDRVYTIYNDDKTTSIEGGGQTGGARTTTLRQLQTTTEIGIVTNDRILLAFCILLGLNVFYTSGMDIARLIYFKNTRDLPLGPALAAIVTQLIATIDRAAVEGIQERIAEHEAVILAARDAFVAGPLATPDIADYILALRSLLSNLGRLRLDFAPSVAQVIANAEILFPPADVAAAASSSESKRLTAANVIISVMSKIDLDIKYNESVLADLANPANPSVDGKERIRLAALKQKLASGGRIPKSVEVTESKEILSQTRNDILQIIGKDATLLVPEMFRTRIEDFPGAAGSRGEINYVELLSVFPAIRVLIPSMFPALGGQRGGALADINLGFEALGARTIRLLPPAPPSGEDSEVTSTINIYKLGASYYDDALNAYTVADEYIVTKDEFPVFSMVFDGLTAPPPPGEDSSIWKLNYICNRYLLLLLDIAWNDLDGMLQEAVESGEPAEGGDIEYSGLFEPGTPTRTRLNQIIETVRAVNAALGAENAIAFVRGVLELHYNPPTGEDTVEVPGLTDVDDPASNSYAKLLEGLSYVEGGVSAARQVLLTNIMSFRERDAARTTELAETMVLEENTNTNYNSVGPITDTYTRYVEPIAQKVLDGLGLRLQAEELGPQLGEVIRSTINQAVVAAAGSEQQMVIDERYVFGSLLETVVEDIVSAIEAWAPPAKNEAEVRRGLAMLADVRTMVSYIRGEEQRAKAAPAAFGGPFSYPVPPGVAAGQGPAPGFQGMPPGVSNAAAAWNPGPSWRGGRRRLYAGLRKRDGSGPNPDV